MDREKTIRIIDELIFEAQKAPTWKAENALRCLKKELLKEQKNGEWIDHTFAHGDDIECPFCHKKWNVIDNCTETFDYCPGCGAKLS